MSLVWIVVWALLALGALWWVTWPQARPPATYDTTRPQCPLSIKSWDLSNPLSHRAMFTVSTWVSLRSGDFIIARFGGRVRTYRIERVYQLGQGERAKRITSSDAAAGFGSEGDPIAPLLGLEVSWPPQ